MDSVISVLSDFISQYSNLISQIIGTLSCIFAIASMQFKNIKIVMLCQLLCNGLGMLSYVILDGFSGFGIYLIATLQSLVFFLFRKFEKEEPRWIYPIIFAAYIGCSLITFKEAWDLAPMIAALFCALALMQKKSSHYRIVILLNSLVWIVYDIHIAAVAMLISHIISASSAFIGILRIDILKK